MKVVGSQSRVRRVPKSQEKSVEVSVVATQLGENTKCGEEDGRVKRSGRPFPRGENS